MNLLIRVWQKIIKIWKEGINPMNPLIRVLQSLPAGTEVTIVTLSGHIIEPAVYVSYSAATGLVTLSETDPLTPGETRTIRILGSRIESVSY